MSFGDTFSALLPGSRGVNYFGPESESKPAGDSEEKEHIEKQSGDAIEVKRENSKPQPTLQHLQEEEAASHTSQPDETSKRMPAMAEENGG